MCVPQRYSLYSLHFVSSVCLQSQWEWEDPQQDELHSKCIFSCIASNKALYSSILIWSWLEFLVSSISYKATAVNYQPDGTITSVTRTNLFLRPRYVCCSAGSCRGTEVEQEGWQSRSRLPISIRCFYNYILHSDIPLYMAHSRPHTIIPRPKSWKPKEEAAQFVTIPLPSLALGETHMWTA